MYSLFISLLTRSKYHIYLWRINVLMLTWNRYCFHNNFLDTMEYIGYMKMNRLYKISAQFWSLLKYLLYINRKLETTGPQPPRGSKGHPLLTKSLLQPACVTVEISTSPNPDKLCNFRNEITKCRHVTKSTIRESSIIT